jgi:hypothetical protein
MGPDFSLLVSTAGIIIAVRIPFVKNYFPRWRKYFPAGFWRGRRSRVPAFLPIGRNMCVLGGFSGHSHPKRLDSLRRGWYTWRKLEKCLLTACLKCTVIPRQQRR